MLLSFRVTSLLTHSNFTSLRFSNGPKKFFKISSIFCTDRHRHTTSSNLINDDLKTSDSLRSFNTKILSKSNYATQSPGAKLTKREKEIIAALKQMEASRTSFKPTVSTTAKKPIVESTAVEIPRDAKLHLCGSMMEAVSSRHLQCISKIINAG